MTTSRDGAQPDRSKSICDRVRQTRAQSFSEFRNGSISVLVLEAESGRWPQAGKRVRSTSAMGCQATLASSVDRTAVIA